ncbi:hypothetical protein [Helicobacter pylori]|uniref:hypothetical protein n=1 Tax=Helicobacter pylori TaxID=210 RepID=UPI0012E7FB0B|nr:hypothetical protein [Helicobacter pylori]MUU19752.1 hypothetical protein [Helicobacter pylori]
MWNEKFLKVIPAAVFLFCILEIFELVMIANDMNKTEELEKGLKTNLEVLEMLTECLKHIQDKNIKIK